MKCPECGAFINPAWERCHVCGGVLKDVPFIETVKPDTPHPADEAAFEREAQKALIRISAELPPDLRLSQLSTYGDYKRHEIALDLIWKEARRSGEYDLSQFRKTLTAWESALIEGAKCTLK